jgi:hypothetical protein
VKLDAAFVLSQPVVRFACGGVVVQNYVNVLVGRQFGNDTIQEALEVFSFFLLRGLSKDLSTGDFQGCE